ncbi:MAG: tRNA pseudouridine(38-40) synthase TruA [Vicinamibacterales bacterium]
MAARLRTLRLVIAYDGAEFAGWQRQLRHRTVQGELERVLEAIEGRPVHVAGAGRTDAGVHAAAQVASVRLTAAIAPERLVRACNASLPVDVRVVAAEEAFDGFHARIHARGKTYRYLIWHAPTGAPAIRRVAWHVPQRLSLSAMQEAARGFLGEHDFAAFRARGSHVRSTVRTIWTSTVEVWPDLPPWTDGAAQPGRLICFEVSGSGFLRHQVRAMAGSLAAVGRNRLTVEALARALAEGRRAGVGPTAPAHGLHLWRVDYGALEPGVPAGPAPAPDREADPT